jgi:hypothetical protein
VDRGSFGFEPVIPFGSCGAVCANAVAAVITESIIDARNKRENFIKLLD